MWEGELVGLLELELLEPAPELVVLLVAASTTRSGRVVA